MTQCNFFLLFLSLWNNLLTYIDENAFHEVRRLKEIDLSRNRISSLKPRVFSGLKNLEKVYLHGNELNLESLELCLETNVKFISFKKEYGNNDIKSIINISSH